MEKSHLKRHELIFSRTAIDTVFSPAEKPLIIGLFCRKCNVKIRHPVSSPSYSSAWFNILVPFWNDILAPFETVFLLFLSRMSMTEITRHSNSYVWNDPLICVKWHINTCEMTHPCVWNETFIYVTCHMSLYVSLIDMSHTYQCLISHIWMTCLIHINVSFHTYEWEWRVPYMNVSFHTCGWERQRGSLKLYVSFAKEPYKRHYIL